jgi:hypothetical protein
MFKWFVISLIVSSVQSLSYICTHQNKDYYGPDALGFQFPPIVYPINQSYCSTDCKPYEEIEVGGETLWVGYQSLCVDRPLFLTYIPDDETIVDVEKGPRVQHIPSDGVYASYPSITVCVSSKKPC